MTPFGGSLSCPEKETSVRSILDVGWKLSLSAIETRPPWRASRRMF